MREYYESLRPREVRILHWSAAAAAVALWFSIAWRDAWVLLLWAKRDDTEELYGDPIPIWDAWADNVTGFPLDSGHHMSEEVPDELAAAIRRFLA